MIHFNALDFSERRFEELVFLIDAQCIILQYFSFYRTVPTM